MFENIGSKIKGLATILCILGIIGSVVLGIAVCSLEDFFIAIGLILMVLGGLLSWILSFFMYGFGQLIENSDTLVAIAKRTEKHTDLDSISKPELQDIEAVSEQPDIKSHEFYCEKKLTDYIIKNGTENVGNNAFDGCINLAFIVIPKSLSKIDDWAFYNCINLKDVYYTGSAKEWASIYIGSGNETLINASIHYYSATQPTDVKSKYWHYVNGIPTLW